MRAVLGLLTILVFLSVPTPADAHPLRPAVVTVTLLKDARVTVAIQANFEAWVAGISAQHSDTRDAPQAALYDQLRKLPGDELAPRIEAFYPQLQKGFAFQFNTGPGKMEIESIDVPEVGDVEFARLSTLVLTGPIPSGATDFTWHLAPEWGNNVLRVMTPESAEAVQSEWLKDGATSKPVSIADPFRPKSRWEIAGTYTMLGLTHIVPLGADHILFVLGIFLLSQRLKPLLWQVTSFTLAHSITLGLSMYGVMSLSPAIVEPLIALSIVYVGVENLITRTLKPWRVVVVFCFGLLHGLGFAGVLTEIGLPQSEFVTALITFNIGVELGQLLVIAGAWVLLAAWLTHKDWYRGRVTLPVSAVISLVGAYWTVERIFF